ncbi:hypothetical protein EJ03DRAFT_323731 [Teratosphaeria nubilosa]|uniref:Uncharacterized protein n=1 Tax=Teratosphaeria nubilosa TaxID=161662 RepID=A0A6G1LK24_9PEZI|nr:hypothetical protein EJ03DRAFT_323731 [Teratosphaeria nubilosa]
MQSQRRDRNLDGHVLDLHQRRKLWWANMLMLCLSIVHMGLMRLAIHVKGPNDWWQMVSMGTYLSDVCLCLSHAWGMVTLLMEIDKAWRARHVRENKCGQI